MIVVGMMSGTSTDGIDAVVVRLEEPRDGARAPQFEILKHASISFEPAQRQEILACLRADTGTVDRICALNFDLGETYAHAAERAIYAAGLEPSDIDLIGNHGQTLWHIPNHSTFQVGSPAVIAERTGITTISNFRARDIAAGGHGAPMVAFVDQLLFADENITRGLQNIGGIANVTYLPAGNPQKSLAFDSGPGNVLIDDAVRRATNGAREFDADGEIAARGRVNAGLLNELMTHPYLVQAPPKTTGREIFGSPFGETLWQKANARGISADDLIATLTIFTARSIADSYKNFLPTMPQEIIVSGGGAKNPTLLHLLQNELDSTTRVRRIDEMGIPAEAKEALAFAILAYETWHGRASNLPRATGAREAVIQGDITPGRYVQFSGFAWRDKHNGK
jgi:anhydro-N-acetylmuramic acid kinase